MHTVNLLTRLVENHQIIAYGIIFLGLLFEGEFFLIFTGILMHLGALNIYITLIVVLLGGLSKTFIGYALGEFLLNYLIIINFLNIFKNEYIVFYLDLKQNPFGLFLFLNL